eukprot:TRINITY_DN11240_c0_g1_i1.p1 TRINITY_DN11240_c0_g1~~TRINITY_DN11240_c0_g1_i1.p1  ORF type:complete len:251 (-),score=44.76 TRINITY_DN11240_c0_g1_i1:39-791(-)
MQHHEADSREWSPCDSRSELFPSRSRIEEANALFVALGLPKTMLIKNAEDEEELQHQLDHLFARRPSRPSSHPIEVQAVSTAKMQSFEAKELTDFKHVIYNILVDGYNNGWDPNTSLITELELTVQDQSRKGFQFNHRLDPDKRMPELYAEHVKMARLDLEDSKSIFIQDIYKYYLRACVELLGKYFQKIDKYRYLYNGDVPLFIAGGSLGEAEERMALLTSRTHKRKEDKPMPESKKSRKTCSQSKDKP